jgi:RHS repeat-associated protein
VDGSIYIADTENHRIRRVGPDGIITTVAGTGTTCNNLLFTCGDDGPAANAQLNSPLGIALGKDGSIYIADGLGIRRVRPDGIITAVTGRKISFPIEVKKDGSPAIDTLVFDVRGIAEGLDGSLYFSQFGLLGGDNRIRKISPDGIITTIAGTGNSCLEGLYSDWPNCGDRALATQAPINPQDITLGPDGSIYIADTSVNRIRKIEPINPLVGDLALIFDSTGRHLETRNALTGDLVYRLIYENYNGSLFLTKIIDISNYTTQIERNPQGKPMAIISPYNQRTTLSLYDDGFLKNITNPAHEVTQFTYKNGAPDLLETFIDPKENAYTFTYDDMGRLVKYEDPPAAGGSSTLVRTDIAKGYTVTLTSAMGRVKTYQVERLPEGGIRRVNVFPCCDQTEVIDRMDGTRKITYSDGTVVTQQLGPDPRRGMSAPITEKLTIKTLSGLIYITTMNRTLTPSDPTNPLSFQTILDTFKINDQAYTIEYDVNLKTITATSPEGRQTIITLDDKGRQVERQVTGLAPTKYEYDSHGRLKTVQFGSGANVRAYALNYDTAPNDDGYLDSITDPEMRTMRFNKYDGAGRIETLTLPDASQIFYDYDANGNMRSLTPPGRPIHTFTYTAVNLPENYIPPNVGAGSNDTHYEYNPDRQLDLITRPDGKKIDFVYDPTSGRLSSISIFDAPSEIGNVAYTYYPADHLSAGHLSSITSLDDETLEFTYDGSLLTSFIWTGTVSGSVEHIYNNDYRIKTETVNGSNGINLAYDGDGLLKQIGALILHRDDPASPETKNGLLRGTTLYNVTTGLGYNDFGELEEYTAIFNSTNGPVTIFENHYPVRDKVGRIKEKTEFIDGNTRTYNYEYDVSGRLWKVYGNGVLILEYTYNANGNRFLFKSDGSVDVDYDNQDRLLRYGNTIYTYTENGELKTKTDGEGQIKYTYDAFGNLYHIDLQNGTKIDYIIDGMNRRIGKKVNGAFVQGLLYSNQLNPVAELDGNNAIISRFVYGTKPNIPDYMIKRGVIYRIISDHLGSPRIVVNAETGAVAQRIDYDEWGNVLVDTNSGFQPFGFAGSIYDPHTGLMRFGVRDYDPRVGRWILKDPILFDGGSSNLYVYVENDPINRIDSLGLHTKCVELRNWINRLESHLPHLWEYLDFLNAELGAWQGPPRIQNTVGGMCARAVGVMPDPETKMAMSLLCAPLAIMEKESIELSKSKAELTIKGIEEQLKEAIKAYDECESEEEQNMCHPDLLLGGDYLLWPMTYRGH